MKRLLSVLVILMLVLTGCGNIEGIVTEKKEASFIVETSTDDSKPEIQEIHLVDITTFSGSVDSFEELEEGQHVRVVPANLTEEFPYILAEKVIVE